MARKPKKDEFSPDSEDLAAVESTSTGDSPLTDALFAAATRHFKSTTIAYGEAPIPVGLEHRSLALQYMMDLQVVPMQSIIHIAGEPKSYKTSAILEFCGMAMAASGVGAVVHTEGKWSNSKMLEMLRKPLSLVSAADSVQGWQRSATAILTSYRELVEKKKAARAAGAKSSKFYDIPLNPMVLGIDSLNGSQSEMIKEKVEADGSGSKTYQDKAMINWQWFSTWGSGLIGMPVIVVISNHLKDKIDSGGYGPPQKVTGGGTGVNFMCSYEIRTKKIMEIKSAKAEGALLEWRCELNSMGRDKRKIQVPYLESYADDNLTRISYYDWDAALINLILAIFEDGTAASKNRIREVLGGDMVEYPRPGGGKVYTCPALGIDRTRALDDDIDATALGRLLQSTSAESLRGKLRVALQIQPATVWTPEVIL